MLNFFLVFFFSLTVLLVPEAMADLHANPYSTSAHGNTSYGVYRLPSTAPYVNGNCVHCHEQHASIDGGTNIPSSYALFAKGYTSPTDNFCVDCHDGTTDVAQTAIINHSYSYRAGGLTTDFVSDTNPGIINFFDSTTNGGEMVSIHDLNEIQKYLKTTGATWGFSSDRSQPCMGCHNPHAVQGDPASNALSDYKQPGARGYPISRPSDFKASTGWELWGDDSSERLSSYAGTAYQAPYYSGSTTTFEPEGNATDDGSNLTDFNTFCLDCHKNIISTGTVTVKAILWDTTEIHGKGIQGSKPGGGGAPSLNLKGPYTDSSITNYVLACTDCHEPHGSTNIKLIRPIINNGIVSLSSSTNANWRTFCVRCHTDPHSPSGDCMNCHVHGDKF